MNLLKFHGPMLENIHENVMIFHTKFMDLLSSSACLGSFFRIPILLFEINNSLYLYIVGSEEAISHWSSKIQAACKALNRVILGIPPRKIDTLRLNLVEFFFTTT